jgi:hypothetical protein
MISHPRRARSDAKRIFNPDDSLAIQTSQNQRVGRNKRSALRRTFERAREVRCGAAAVSGIASLHPTYGEMNYLGSMYFFAVLRVLRG